MRKTSVRELHAEGGIIVIERRAEPIAELRPITAPQRMPAGKKARIFDSMREIRARMPQVTAREIGEREVWTHDLHMLAATAYFGLTGRSV